MPDPQTEAAQLAEIARTAHNADPWPPEALDRLWDAVVEEPHHRAARTRTGDEQTRIVRYLAAVEALEGRAREQWRAEFGPDPRKWPYGMGPQVERDPS